jgi:hypothetical protein
VADPEVVALLVVGLNLIVRCLTFARRYRVRSLAWSESMYASQRNPTRIRERS